jgi:hypothetical protein
MASSQSVIYTPRGASFRQRLTCLLQNFINQPALLNATPPAGFFQSSSTVHYTQSMFMQNTTDLEDITRAGLHLEPNLFRIDFTISTEAGFCSKPDSSQTAFVTVSNAPKRPEVGASALRVYNFVASAKCYDNDGNVILIQNNQTGMQDSVLASVCGWTDSPKSEDMAPRLDSILNWQCVVEWLKYFTKLYAGKCNLQADPLIHMGILGVGPTMRRMS